MKYARREFIKTLSVGVLGWLFFGVEAMAAERKPMTAKEILHAVEQKYSQCRSYSDEGTAETNDLKGNRVQLSFKTYFVRPSRFRFDWQDWSPARPKTEDFSTLRWDGRATYSKYPWQEYYPDTLIAGISGATGCSAGAASMISSLLLTGYQHSGLLSLDNAQLLAAETRNGTTCYVITGSLGEDRFTLWVSKGDFRILRVKSGSSANLSEAKAKGEFFVEYAFTGIKFDKPISSNVFEFSRPKSVDGQS